MNWLHWAEFHSMLRDQAGQLGPPWPVDQKVYGISTTFGMNRGTTWYNQQHQQHGYKQNNRGIPLNLKSSWETLIQQHATAKLKN